MEKIQTINGYKFDLEAGLIFSDDANDFVPIDFDIDEEDIVQTFKEAKEAYLKAKEEGNSIAESPQTQPTSALAPEPPAPAPETPQEPQTLREKEPSADMPICPHCGKALEKEQLGNETVFRHPAGDPCRYEYLSLEEIQREKEKLDRLKKAAEEEKKKKRKMELDEALIKAAEDRKAIDEALRAMNATLEKTTAILEQKATETNEILDKKIQNFMETVNKEKGLDQNQAREEMDEKLDELKQIQTDINSKIQNIDSALEKINKEQGAASRSEDALNAITAKLNTLQQSIQTVEINWDLTTKPITPEEIAELINQAGEYQPYNSVKDELTILNNIIKWIVTFQKAINAKLFKAQLKNPEEIKPIEEVAAIGRRLFNVWPPKVQIQRRNGLPKVETPKSENTKAEEVQTDIARSIQ